MLFVATGSNDEAFQISTEQMKSLLALDDLFVLAQNTSCSLMNNVKHTTSALDTYIYHILPCLFVDTATLQNDGF